MGFSRFWIFKGICANFVGMGPMRSEAECMNARFRVSGYEALAAVRLAVRRYPVAKA